MTDIVAETPSIERVEALFGGRKVLGRRLTGPLDAHDLLLDGLPSSALQHLLARLIVLPAKESLGKAVGMSLRTYQRHQVGPVKALSAEQSGRAWKFAEILSRATEIFGSQEDAEHWLERPAIGLEQRKPIDLLATPAGVEMIDNHLTRLEYGVYT